MEDTQMLIRESMVLPPDASRPASAEMIDVPPEPAAVSEPPEMEDFMDEPPEMKIQDPPPNANSNNNEGLGQELDSLFMDEPPAPSQNDPAPAPNNRQDEEE